MAIEPDDPGAPTDIQIPLNITLAGSGQVQTGGVEFQAESTGSINPVVSITPSFLANAAESEVVVVCGFNQCGASDSFSDFYTFDVPVDTGVLTFRHETQADISGTTMLSGGTEQPLIEIDPAFMVDIGGVPTRAADVYRVVYSPGVQVPEPSVGLGGFAVLSALIGLSCDSRKGL